uniref:ARID domain-containing protein n=1 Tax=Parastrongyloides trichosuri TaxID=131310 RepID=A0A0N4Z678_PARTI
MPFGDSLNRKLLLNPTASYISLLSEEDRTKPEKDFFASYGAFCRRKWSLQKPPQPSINGAILNLYELFTIVKNFGGFMKVTNHDLWPEVTKSLNLPGAINETALAKYYYQRYLLYFEECESGTGETEVDPDENSSSNMGTRSRGRIYFSSNDNPVSVRKINNHNTSNMLTKDLGYVIGHCSEDGPDYHKLMKHLLSGFENENVFARNLLSMMASPGPYHLQLEQCPMIIDIILAKIGIFPVKDPIEFKAGFGENYLNDWRNKEHCDFDLFWEVSGIKEEYAIGLIERKDIVEAIIKYNSEEEVCGMKYNNEDIDFLFNPSIQMSEKDPIYFRVLHTTKIIRELSFDNDNRKVLKRNINLLTFLMCIAFSRYECLHQNVMDTLSNLSEDLELNDLLISNNHFGCFLKLIKSCLLSKDRMKICFGLEILGNIASKEGNEMFVTDLLVNEKEIIQQISLLLVPMDVMSLTHTLETIYDLTSMGPTMCDLFAKDNGILKQLYALLTVEANKFGPCYIQGTKIIQYKPQFQPGQKPVRKFTQTPINRTMGTHQMSNQMGQMRSQITNRPVTNPQIHTPSMPIRRPSRIEDNKTVGSQNDLPVVKINEDQEKINLTREWIRSYLKFDPSYESSIKRGKLYCDYVNHFNNKKMLSLNMKNFITLIREMFPKVKLTNDDGQTNSSLLGIVFMAPGSFPSSTSKPINPFIGSNNIDSHNDHTVLVKTIFNAQAEKEKIAAMKVGGNESVSRKRKLTNSSLNYNLESMRESVSPDGTSSVSEEYGPSSKVEGLSSHSDISSPLPKINNEIKIENVSCSSIDSLTNDSNVIKVSNIQCGYNENTENEHPIQKIGGEEITTALPESILQQKLSQKSPLPSEYYEKIDSPICEWQDCGQVFATTNKLYYHMYRTHTINDEMVCKWNGCERIIRGFWSLLSHIHETHCKKPISDEARSLRMKHGNREYIEQILKKKWKEQEGKKPYNIPVKNSFVPPHAEYHKTTLNGKVVITPISNDFTNVPEGPVTKSVRLTAALILRNIVTYSCVGREYLKRYESFISYLAFSKLEANTALSNYLYEIKNTIDYDGDKDHQNGDHLYGLTSDI